MPINALIQLIQNSTQHRYIYHFTDEANFTSIAQRGLLSKTRMRAENLWPSAPGGNQLSHDLDTARGIDPYVSLCLTRSHPMEYRARTEGRLLNPRYLGINPEVLNIAGALISFGVANGTDTEIVPIASALNRLDTEVIYTRTDWSDHAIRERLRAAEKIEVLIPDIVPRNLIAGVF